MHLSITSALLGPALVVSGAALPQGSSFKNLAPPAPITSFPTGEHHVIQPDELFSALSNNGIDIIGKIAAPLANILDDLTLPGGTKPGASVKTTSTSTSFSTSFSTSTSTSTSVATTTSTSVSEAKTASTDDSEVKTESVDDDSVSTTAATCSSPRQRTEWDSYSADDKKAYLKAINCLRGKPASGNYSPAGNRYEDIVRVHQNMTPTIHENGIFLLWHRYFTWTFEDILRTECGFDRNLPWWNEGANTGKFAASSVFSGDYYGAIAVNGNCVTNGAFANSNLNIGPGDGNSVHCLSRSGNNNYTKQLTEDLVSAVNSWPEFKDMAYYAEGTFHAYGHLGVGAVQADKYASPGDPWFFLHHGYVDRNFASWQSSDSSRLTKISGTDINGNNLTMDTVLDVSGLRPSVKIRDVMNTQSSSSKLCYKY